MVPWWVWKSPLVTAPTRATPSVTDLSSLARPSMDPQSRQPWLAPGRSPPTDPRLVGLARACRCGALWASPRMATGGVGCHPLPSPAKPMICIGRRRVRRMPRVFRGDFSGVGENLKSWKARCFKFRFSEFQFPAAPYPASGITRGCMGGPLSTPSRPSVRNVRSLSESHSKALFWPRKPESAAPAFCRI